MVLEPRSHGRSVAVTAVNAKESRVDVKIGGVRAICRAELPLESAMATAQRPYVDSLCPGLQTSYPRQMQRVGPRRPHLCVRADSQKYLVTGCVG